MRKLWGASLSRSPSASADGNNIRGSGRDLASFLKVSAVSAGTLASLIRQARQRTQLIVSTQSAGLLNAFEPKDIVVIDRMEGESQFRRLSEQELRTWLDEEYSLGELWQKEVYGGGPVHE